MKSLLIVQSMIASLIFFPTQEYSALPKDYGLASEMVRITTKGGTQLEGWFLPAADSKGTIYLLHGNAGNISDRLFKAASWISIGFSVFLLDYRSYGKSSGKITSENDIYEDASAGLLWLREEKKQENSKIILYGESIGAAPVLELASKGNFFAVILEAPFTSLSSVAKMHYPFVPDFVMNRFRFENLEKISKVKSPIYIIHGEKDEICPFEMGKTLFEKAREPKEFFRIPGGHHNDLTDIAGKEFYEKPALFLANLQKKSQIREE